MLTVTLGIVLTLVSVLAMVSYIIVIKLLLAMLVHSPVSRGRFLGGASEVEGTEVIITNMYL